MPATIPKKPDGVSLRDWLLDNGFQPVDVNRVETEADGSLTVILISEESLE